MIGCADGSIAREDRLAHLDRQLVAHGVDGVADLVRGLDHVLLEVEDDHDLRLALEAVERIW
jgi:hypothetical protein